MYLYWIRYKCFDVLMSWFTMADSEEEAIENVKKYSSEHSLAPYFFEGTMAGGLTKVIRVEINKVIHG